MGPLRSEDMTGVLRLDAAGKVLEGRAEVVGAVVTLTWGTASFAKVAVGEGDVKGEGSMSIGAVALVSAETDRPEIF